MIDDGSTDETLNAARSYAPLNPRVRVFTQENAGVSAARNYGIRKAKGEYLYFLDSDDWLEDNAISILLEAQAQFPDSFIAARYYKVKEMDGKFFRTTLNSPDIPSGLMSIEEFTEHFCELGTIKGLHSCCAKIYRAGFGLTFNEDIHYSEDGIYTFEYLNKMAGAYYVNKSLLNVFISEQSLTRSPSYRPDMLDSQVNAYDILENYPDNTPYISELMQISRCIYILIPLNWSLERGASSSKVKMVRDAIKPYAGLFLSCKKVTLKKKLAFLYKTYTPIWLARCLKSLHKKLNDLKEKFTRHGQEIPRW